MKASIRGTELYFDVAGMQLVPDAKGYIERPVLFLLHGGPGNNHFKYKTHSIQLQEAAQLVFIDHRGCGWSKRTKKADYTMENNIEDIEALRQHLGLERICVLGTSYGGMVAQGYAIRYGKYVDKLILAVTAPSYRFMESAKRVLHQVGSPEQIAVCDRYLWKGQFKNNKEVEHYFKIMDSLYSVRGKLKGKPPAGALRTLFSYQALNAGFGGFLQHYDFIPQLKKITCPTLILAGQNDWICPPDQAQVLAQHIPHAKLKIFKNCGHAMALDAPLHYLRAIKGFLK